MGVARGIGFALRGGGTCSVEETRQESPRLATPPTLPTPPSIPRLLLLRQRTVFGYRER